MDRALKERIIGAVVLVTIIVLVVPVFLDGPAVDGEMISEPVVLPGQSREPGARKTVVLQRDRDEPLPETPRDGAHPVSAATRDAAPARAEVAKPAPEAPPAASTDGSRASAALAKPEEKPEEKPEAAPARPEKDAPRETAPDIEPATAESSTGMWAVQLGSFSNKANADRLAASLREDGYAAFLSQLRTSSGELHRVRIGPQKDRESAEAVAARLSAAGLKGQVVPHP